MNMPKLPWLKPVIFHEVKRNGVVVKVPRYRRTLADKGKRVEPEQIYEWVEKNHWPYKQDKVFLRLRDKALIALTYLLCGRIGEVLALNREQFKEHKNFLVVNEFIVEKNKVSPIRDPWALPKRGRLSPFTEIILEYLKVLPKNQSKLFTIKRARAHQIVKKITGKWCHWFRAMGEAYLMRYVFKEPVKCASALRLRRSDTLIEYVPYNWEDYAKELSA